MYTSYRYHVFPRLDPPSLRPVRCKRIRAWDHSNGSPALRPMRWASSSRPVGGKKGRGLVVKPLGKSWENGGLLGILGGFMGLFQKFRGIWGSSTDISSVTREQDWTKQRHHLRRSLFKHVTTNL
jgi:hypothetical protein